MADVQPHTEPAGQIVSVGDDHKTHAWGKWHPIGALFSAAVEQQRECVICNFAERVPITKGRG